MTVRVLCDRGLQSPRLWAAIRRQGWHPYMRYDRHMTFQATTGPRGPAGRFVAHEGQYTVTAGRAFRERKRRCTLIVLWLPGQETPWVVLTDEPPDDVDLGAYGLRVWIEQGFRTRKRMGWQWHGPRARGPALAGPGRGHPLGPGPRHTRGGGPPARPGLRARAPTAPDPGGRGPGPTPECVSTGLVPGLAAVAPRIRLGPGLAAAPAGTGSARGTATGRPANRVAPFSHKDADWNFTYPCQPGTTPSRRKTCGSATGRNAVHAGAGYRRIPPECLWLWVPPPLSQRGRPAPEYGLRTGPAHRIRSQNVSEP